MLSVGEVEAGYSLVVVFSLQFRLWLGLGLGLGLGSVGRGRKREGERCSGGQG